jgi:hypothetical protein
MGEAAAVAQAARDFVTARGRYNVSIHKRSALLALASLIIVTFPAVSVSTSGASPRRMTPLQVADFAVKCASRNKGPKITTYFDIRCAAAQSSNISVSAGVVGGPTEFPAYASIGFLLDKTTEKFTCFAYPKMVGASPINITTDCPLWIMPREYAKTNYASVYSIAAASLTDAASQLPTLAQVQEAATAAQGSPSVSAGSGDIFVRSISPELTLRLSYSAGVGRDWCLWFYETIVSGENQMTFLISPPGMYGTC